MLEVLNRLVFVGLQRAVVFVLAAFLAPSIAAQAYGGADSAPSGLVFAAIGELTPSRELSPLLRGGRSVRDPAKWGASLYEVSGRPCTSTLIGPKALLLAAHCIADGGTVQFKLGGNDFHGSCTRSPKFAADRSADYALCEIRPAVVGITFERIVRDPTLLEKRAFVLLSGFGCTEENGTGGNDGTFRIGESDIHSLPPKTGNIVVTKGGAALCLGDSGGAVYTEEGSKRRVVAVNVEAAPDGGGFSDMSRIATLSSQDAIDFFDEWLRNRSGVQVCGIGTDRADCRR